MTNSLIAPSAAPAVVTTSATVSLAHAGLVAMKGRWRLTGARALDGEALLGALKASSTLPNPRNRGRSTKGIVAREQTRIVSMCDEMIWESCYSRLFVYAPSTPIL